MLKKDKSLRLSRSRWDNFIKCPKCFYLKEKHNIKPPSQPGHPINSRVDTLLKEEFDILRKDGVVNNEFNQENLSVSNIEDIISRNENNISWSHRLINTENNSATLISQIPGEGNRRHYHPNWNEWWYIIKGQWLWEIEGEEFLINEGDIVFIEKNKKHKITAAGTEPAIRLAVSRADVPHIYDVE